MKKILFDSDVVIEYLRESPRVVSEVDQLVASSAILAVTPVTEAEILQGLRSHERMKTEKLLGSMDCLDLNRQVGRLAGQYLRKFARSHGLEVPDALIAAAAVVHRFSLCSFNWRHYPMSDIERHRIE